jgi:hypothetical protein
MLSAPRRSEYCLTCLAARVTAIAAGRPQPGLQSCHRPATQKSPRHCTSGGRCSKRTAAHDQMHSPQSDFDVFCACNHPPTTQTRQMFCAAGDMHNKGRPPKKQWHTVLKHKGHFGRSWQATLWCCGRRSCAHGLPLLTHLLVKKTILSASPSKLAQVAPAGTASMPAHTTETHSFSIKMRRPHGDMYLLVPPSLRPLETSIQTGAATC